MHCENKYLSYFKYYRDEEIPSDFAWWYCLIDNKVYETTELYNMFGYSSKDEIYATKNFIEFYRVDIIELKKKYLSKKNPNRYKALISLPDKNFDIKFNEYIDSNNLIQNWYEFEQDALRVVFLKWSFLNGIVLK